MKSFLKSTFGKGKEKTKSDSAPTNKETFKFDEANVMSYIDLSEALVKHKVGNKIKNGIELLVDNSSVSKIVDSFTSRTFKKDNISQYDASTMWTALIKIIEFANPILSDSNCSTLQRASVLEVTNLTKQLPDHNKMILGALFATCEIMIQDDPTCGHTVATSLSDALIWSLTPGSSDLRDSFCNLVNHHRENLPYCLIFSRRVDASQAPEISSVKWMAILLKATPSSSSPGTHNKTIPHIQSSNRVEEILEDQSLMARLNPVDSEKSRYTQQIDTSAAGLQSQQSQGREESKLALYKPDPSSIRRSLQLNTVDTNSPVRHKEEPGIASLSSLNMQNAPNSGGKTRNASIASNPIVNKQQGNFNNTTWSNGSGDNRSQSGGSAGKTSSRRFEDDEEEEEEEDIEEMADNSHIVKQSSNNMNNNKQSINNSRDSQPHDDDNNHPSSSFSSSFSTTLRDLQEVFASSLVSSVSLEYLSLAFLRDSDEDFADIKLLAKNLKWTLRAEELSENVLSLHTKQENKKGIVSWTDFIRLARPSLSPADRAFTESQSTTYDGVYQIVQSSQSQSDVKRGSQSKGVVVNNASKHAESKSSSNSSGGGGSKFKSSSSSSAFKHSSREDDDSDEEDYNMQRGGRPGVGEPGGGRGSDSDSDDIPMLREGEESARHHYDNKAKGGGVVTSKQQQQQQHFSSSANGGDITSRFDSDSEEEEKEEEDRNQSGVLSIPDLADSPVRHNIKHNTNNNNTWKSSTAGSTGRSGSTFNLTSSIQTDESFVSENRGGGDDEGDNSWDEQDATPVESKHDNTNKNSPHYDTSSPVDAEVEEFNLRASREREARQGGKNRPAAVTNDSRQFSSEKDRGVSSSNVTRSSSTGSNLHSEGYISNDDEEEEEEEEDEFGDSVKGSGIRISTGRNNRRSSRDPEDRNVAELLGGSEEGRQDIGRSLSRSSSGGGAGAGGVSITKRSSEPAANTSSTTTSNANSSRPIVTAKRHPPAKKGMFSLTAVDRSVESVDASQLRESHEQGQEEDKQSVDSEESLKTADSDTNMNSPAAPHLLQRPLPTTPCPGNVLSSANLNGPNQLQAGQNITASRQQSNSSFASSTGTGTGADSVTSSVGGSKRKKGLMSRFKSAIGLKKKKDADTPQVDGVASHTPVDSAQAAALNSALMQNLQQSGSSRPRSSTVDTDATATPRASDLAQSAGSVPASPSTGEKKKKKSIFSVFKSKKDKDAADHSADSKQGGSGIASSVDMRSRSMSGSEEGDKESSHFMSTPQHNERTIAAAAAASNLNVASSVDSSVIQHVAEKKEKEKRGIFQRPLSADAKQTESFTVSRVAEDKQESSLPVSRIDTSKAVKQPSVLAFLSHGKGKESLAETPPRPVSVDVPSTTTPVLVDPVTVTLPPAKMSAEPRSKSPPRTAVPPLSLSDLASSQQSLTSQNLGESQRLNNPALKKQHTVHGNMIRFARSVTGIKKGGSRSGSISGSVVSDQSHDDDARSRTSSAADSDGSTIGFPAEKAASALNIIVPPFITAQSSEVSAHTTSTTGSIPPPVSTKSSKPSAAPPVPPPVTAANSSSLVASNKNRNSWSSKDKVKAAADDAIAKRKSLNLPRGYSAASNKLPPSTSGFTAPSLVRLQSNTQVILSKGPALVVPSNGRGLAALLRGGSVTNTNASNVNVVHDDTPRQHLSPGRISSSDGNSLRSSVVTLTAVNKLHQALSRSKIASNSKHSSTNSATIVGGDVLADMKRIQANKHNRDHDGLSSESKAGHNSPMFTDKKIAQGLQDYAEIKTRREAQSVFLTRNDLKDMRTLVKEQGGDIAKRRKAAERAVKQKLISKLPTLQLPSPDFLQTITTTHKHHSKHQPVVPAPHSQLDSALGVLLSGGLLKRVGTGHKSRYFTLIAEPKRNPNLRLGDPSLSAAPVAPTSFTYNLHEYSRSTTSIWGVVPLHFKRSFCVDAIQSIVTDSTAARKGRDFIISIKLTPIVAPVTVGADGLVTASVRVGAVRSGPSAGLEGGDSSASIQPEEEKYESSDSEDDEGSLVDTGSIADPGDTHSVADSVHSAAGSQTASSSRGGVFGRTKKDKSIKLLALRAASSDERLQWVVALQRVCRVGVYVNTVSY